MIRRRIVEVAAVAALVVAAITAMLVPPEQSQGNLSKLLFVHVPAIWLAYVAFLVTLIGSAAYLVTKNLKWDRRAAASAEIGVLFTGLTILLGMIWGKATWTVWWTWDARLVLTAVMFFVYFGYLALRRAIPHPDLRASRSAVFGLLAVVQIPLVHFSVIWWRTLHQPPSITRPGPMQMDPPYWAALLVGVVAFSTVYAALLLRRLELSRLAAALDEALAASEVAVAGAAIAAPRLDGLVQEHV